MSANYWSSSQRTKWQLTRSSLLDCRRKVLILEKKLVQNGLIKDLNIQYDFNMRIYLHNLLIKLGKRLNLRQIAIASAEIYLIRFLIKVSIKEINVYLLVTTCLYVACKVEECPQHIRIVLSESRSLWPEYIPQDMTKLAEFEFYLIEELNSYLFLHHPYKSLIEINNYFSSSHSFSLSDDELQTSWSLINDSYITDLHLFLPPHIIAIASIYITIVLKKNLSKVRQNEKNLHIDDILSLKLDKKFNHQFDLDSDKINIFMNFLNQSHINLDQVVEAMQDMINLYVVWNRYNEPGVKKALLLMLLTR